MYLSILSQIFFYFIHNIDNSIIFTFLIDKNVYSFFGIFSKKKIGFYVKFFFFRQRNNSLRPKAMDKRPRTQTPNNTGPKKRREHGRKENNVSKIERILQLIKKAQQPKRIIADGNTKDQQIRSSSSSSIDCRRCLSII